MSNETEKETIIKVCNQALGQLREYCDSVHIFVTKQCDDGSNNTISFNVGSGNWFARMGQVREHLVKQDAISSHEAVESIEEE